MPRNPWIGVSEILHKIRRCWIVRSCSLRHHASLSIHPFIPMNDICQLALVKVSGIIHIKSLLQWKRSHDTTCHNFRASKSVAQKRYFVQKCRSRHKVVKCWVGNFETTSLKMSFQTTGYREHTVNCALFLQTIIFLYEYRPFLNSSLFTLDHGLLWCEWKRGGDLPGKWWEGWMGI